MKRHLSTLSSFRNGAAAIAGLAVACLGATSYGGWNPFSPGSPVKVGPQSGQIAIADFNGDGHGDLLVSHSLNGRASLLLGDGRGEFPMSGRTTIAFGYNPAAMAVGDVNGDKRPDLAVASRDGSTTSVHILLGGANAEFNEIPDSAFAAGQIDPKSWKPWLALADVNGDHRLDLVFANGRTNRVDVFLGSGAGQFALKQSVVLDEGFDRYTHVIGDINGDAQLDMAVAGTMASGDEPGRLIVLLGADKGQLVEAPDLAGDIPSSAYVRTLCDINGDKRSDIVLTHGTSMTVLVQNKDGKLAPSPASPFAIGREAFGIAAVNAGLQGNDVLVAATVDNLDVVYADESGNFQHACNTPTPAGPGAYQVAVGDLNDDGKVDVVANSFEGDALSLLLSN